MKLMVTGAAGQVGSDLVRLGRETGHEVVALLRSDLDITNQAAVYEAVGKHSPDWVVNCAAYNAVDAAEDNREEAFRVNGLAPAYLALATLRNGAGIVHFSTDYVFDGTLGRPYREDDLPNPLSVYGHSKLLGEQGVRGINPRHYVLRTSWVYSDERGFPSRIRARALAGEKIRLAWDVVSAPTYSGDLVTVVLRILETAVPSGTYHASGARALSPVEWARRTVCSETSGAQIESCRLDQAACRAVRPRMSVLECARLAACGIVSPEKTGHETVNANAPIEEDSVDATAI